MRLFKKKEKKIKPGNKKGCMTKLMVVILFLAVFVVGLVNGVNSISQLYGSRIETVMEYINAINEPIDESEVIFNPVGAYTDFANEASTFGFNGYGNLDNVLTLETSMTYSDNIFGALISNHIHKKTELLTLGEFTISSQNTIRAVYVYDLGALSSALEEAGDIIPDKMYITVNYEYTIVDIGDGLKKITYTIINQQLNKLSISVSEDILNYMDKVDEADVQNPLDTYEEVVFSVINTIAIKTQSVLSLDTGTITYTK